MIDEPAAGSDRTGGKVAAPVFKKIAEGILALSGNAPCANGQLVNNKDEEQTVVSSLLHNSEPRAGKMLGEWIMPDLKGSDLRQVVDICGKIKCDLSIEGVGHVSRQTPNPGDLIREGGAIKVSCSGGVY